MSDHMEHGSQTVAVDDERLDRSRRVTLTFVSLEQAELFDQCMELNAVMTGLPDGTTVTL